MSGNGMSEHQIVPPQMLRNYILNRSMVF